MKKYNILLLLGIISLASSCNHQTSTTSEKSSDSVSTSEDVSVDNSSSSNNDAPVEVYQDTFIESESSKRLILSSTNNTNTAISSWEAKYDKYGITFTIKVKDDDVYGGNIYNAGYDDNVELLINVKSQSSGWVVNKTHHFLMAADGDTLFERAVTTNGLGASYDQSLGVVLGENLSYSFRLMNEENGYIGYKTEVFFSYDVLNTTYEEAFGNLTFCPGMRNTHTYSVDSTWSAYNKRNCAWGNSSTFIGINDDGSFGEKLNQEVDILYVGDTLLDPTNWQTFEKDNEDVKVLNASASFATISYFNKEIESYSECKTDDVVLYLGYNDIVNGNASVNKHMENFVSKVHKQFASANIHLVSVVSLSASTNIEKVNSLNEHLKTIASSNDYVHFIDIREKLSTNGVLKSHLLYDNGRLNFLGSNMIYEKINESLSINKQDLHNVFGGNSLFASSSGYDKKDQMIEGTGAKDQYLILKAEPATSISFEADISAVDVYNNDAYPKFGLVLMSENTTMFFYIDGSHGLTTQRVGYVRGNNHTSWQWVNSVEKDVTINYTNNNFVTLKVVKEGNLITLYVNDEIAFEVSNFFAETEKVSAGVLTFNTHILLNNWKTN